MNSMIRTLLAATALGLGTMAMAPAIAAEETMMQDEENVNAPYNEILATYLSEKDGINLFDYGAVTSEDRAKLAAYVEELQGLKPSQMSVDEQIAYWANLYNALTLDLVLDAYPVSSIRKIHGGVFRRGPWKKKIVQVAGRSLSLDDIEHGILREEWSDPRIHYSVNCASIGCPNIRAEAWEAETLDEDLDNAARAFINHPRAVRRDVLRILNALCFPRELACREELATEQKQRGR